MCFKLWLHAMFRFYSQLLHELIFIHRSYSCTGCSCVLFLLEREQFQSCRLSGVNYPVFLFKFIINQLLFQYLMRVILASPCLTGYSNVSQEVHSLLDQSLCIIMSISQEILHMMKDFWKCFSAWHGEFLPSMVYRELIRQTRPQTSIVINHVFIIDLSPQVWKSVFLDMA